MGTLAEFMAFMIKVTLFIPIKRKKPTSALRYEMKQSHSALSYSANSYLCQEGIGEMI